MARVKICNCLSYQATERRCRYYEVRAALQTLYFLQHPVTPPLASSFPPLHHISGSLPLVEVLYEGAARDVFKGFPGIFHVPRPFDFVVLNPILVFFPKILSTANSSAELDELDDAVGMLWGMLVCGRGAGDSARLSSPTVSRK